MRRGEWWRRHPAAGRAELGVPAKSKRLHDCRGMFVTKLCRTDLTNEEIARIVAWSADNVERIRRPMLTTLPLLSHERADQAALYDGL